MLEHPRPRPQKFGLETSSPAGDRSSFLEGILRYCNSERARRSSCATECFVHLRSNFFMAFTVASAFPSDAGYPGEEVTCFTPQSLRKVASCCDLNCGPPLDHIVSETAVHEK